MHDGSESYHTFISRDGVVPPALTTHGGCNSAENFQTFLEPCFAILTENMLTWLDDFVLHAETEPCIPKVIEKILLICRDHSLVISLPKSTFLATITRWYGCIIDAEGVRMNPSYYDGVREAFQPETASELCQFLRFMAWVAFSIPMLAERASPLYDTKEKS